jgi:hypothetical protein
MCEAIVTLVIPATAAEPAHTVVYRIEFDSAREMSVWLQASRQAGLNEELLTAQQLAE